MERKTRRTCVDPALEKLERLRDELPGNPDLKDPIHTMQLDLRFFQMFFWGLEHWEETEKVLHLRSVVRTMESELRKTAKEIAMKITELDHRGEISNWLRMSSQLTTQIKTFKSQARKSCIVFLGGAFKCKSYSSVRRSVYGSQTVGFLGLILDNLELLNLQLDLIAPLKQQIGFIVGKLKLFKNFVHLVSRTKTEDERLDKLLFSTRTWAGHVSCLACLYWIDEMDESQACTTTTVLSDLMLKNITDVITLYLDVPTDTRYCKTEEIHQLTQIGARYVDILLEDLDDIEILREGLIILLAFVMDSRKMNSENEKLIWTQIFAVTSDAPSIICSILFGEMTEGISMSAIKFSDFLQKMDRLKAEVRKLYVPIPLSSESSAPRTNATGFLDFLLGNLKKMLEMELDFIVPVKHPVHTIWQELASLRPFLQNITELQNHHEEIKDPWTQIISILYNADYVIKLTSVLDVPLWYRIICLSSVIGDIKLFKIKVKEIQDNQAYESKKHHEEMESSDALPREARTSKFGGAFIGFEEDARSIMDQLVGGQKDLTIISISGMPGQGKTTLAKRIYNDPKIHYYFPEIVWCYVSKECKARELLAEILGVVSNVDVKLEIQDLTERLWKSLRGRRYFIVMDDIWDVELWRTVERTFPNDRNGSRIMFTSRNHSLASQAKPNSISHPLRLFYDEESWELMREKLFNSNDCPEEFVEIGKQIAIYCKGLPLAVDLISSLIGRTEPKLDLWNQIAENMKSHLASEGCLHIIELSYRYLADHLKACFLYFGAFPRGKSIHARTLKNLWIAEGFVNENEMQSSVDLTKEYLDNLVSLSLVVVTERSSRGGIKTCSVHDLLYDLCLEKAAEENFLHLADKSTVVEQCCFSPQKYNHHRLCIGTRDSFAQPRPICSREELPTSQVHSLLWSSDESWVPTDESFCRFLNSFKVLTVLDFCHLLLPGNWFPEVILSIFHLRYLALCFNNNVRIPPSIADLWNLETLIVKKGQTLEPLPDSMWKMRRLRHVDVSYSVLHLDALEKNNSFAACNIETLRGLHLEYNRQTEEFFKRLQKLRKLEFQCGRDFHPKLFSMLESLKKLESLKVGLAHILYYAPYKKYPAFNLPENIKKLALSGFGLAEVLMPTIGKLPNLEVLKLLCAFKGIWDLKDVEFSKLRYLKLYMSHISQIKVHDGDHPFPCLEELVVEGCVELEEIPSCFGEIETLETIRVGSSHKAALSAWRVWKQHKDTGNNSLHVFATSLFGSNHVDRWIRVDLDANADADDEGEEAED